MKTLSYTMFMLMVVCGVLVPRGEARGLARISKDRMEIIAGGIRHGLGRYISRDGLPFTLTRSLSENFKAFFTARLNTAERYVQLYQDDYPGDELLRYVRKDLLDTREDYQKTFSQYYGFLSEKFTDVNTKTGYLSIATLAEEVGGVAQGMRSIFQVILTKDEFKILYGSSNDEIDLIEEGHASRAIFINRAKINQELYPKIAHHIIEKTKRVEEYANSVQPKVLDRWQAEGLAKGGDDEAINSDADMFMALGATIPLSADSGQETEAMVEIEKVTNQHAVAFADMAMIRETMAVIRAALIDEMSGLNVVTTK